jgi:hypothetical protein
MAEYYAQQHASPAGRQQHKQQATKGCMKAKALGNYGASN